MKTQQRNSASQMVEGLFCKLNLFDFLCTRECRTFSYFHATRDLSIISVLFSTTPSPFAKGVIGVRELVPAVTGYLVLDFLDY